MKFDEKEWNVQSEKRGWLLFRYDGDSEMSPGDCDYHIIPVSDNEAHHIALSCPCGAKVIKIHSRGVVISHFPFDDREPDPFGFGEMIDNIIRNDAE